MEALSTPVRLVKEHRADGQLRVSQGDPLPGGELQDLGELRIRPGRARLGHDIGRHGGGEGVSAHGQPAAQGIGPVHRLDLDELHALSDHQHAAKR